MARVLVLGGTGFLGRHVLRLAQEAGHTAFSLSRREGCDVTDLKAFGCELDRLKPDAVVNCAAHVGSVHYVTRHTADVVHDNLQILLNVYRGVGRVCPEAKVINPISNCSYPGEAQVHYEPDWLRGPVHDSVLAYGNPKRTVYVVAECYQRQWGVKSVNWLMANAYGPGGSDDPDKVHALNGLVIRLLQAQASGRKRFEIWGSGKPVREWCYVEDAARILVDSLETDDQVYPVNFAQNQGCSIAQVARIAAEELGYDVEFTFNTQYGDGAPTKVLDDRQFRAKYPQFRFTPLREGIRKTIEYYQSVLVHPITPEGSSR